MKIPFDIKFRPQIESGEYKVETRDGKPVRIICWDKKSEKKYGYHIVGLVEFGPQHEESTYYTIDGKGRLKDKEPELFVVIPEPDLTEFEKGIKRGFLCAGLEDVPTGIIKDTAKELLELAKKELCKGCAANIEGYIKGRQDALKEIEEGRTYKYEGPTIPTYIHSCPYNTGGCTNPMRDCINCPSYPITGISTTTGTSTVKLKG